MATILDVMNRAARQCSVKEPTSWIVATAAEYVELRDDFLRQTYEDIIARYDWPSPISSSTTIAGDGSETYDLPSNFLRVQRDQQAVHDSLDTVYTCPITTDSEWDIVSSNGVAGANRFYRVQGYDGNFTMSFLPALSVNVTVHYVTNLWMASAGGTPGTTWTANDDVLLLPDRLVEYGVVWRFRERRGLDYEQYYRRYEALFERFLNDARGRRVINVTPPRGMRWQDAIPAFIPPA